VGYKTIEKLQKTRIVGLPDGEEII